MNRLDYRNLETFKKDIYFSTKLEEFWFKLYLRQICHKYDAIEYEDSGTDNSGKYTKRATKKADYTVHLHKNGSVGTIKLDIKWAPTFGKATFKVSNLKSYIADGSNILLFYNIGPAALRKPGDYNIKVHIDKILSRLEEIRYGIIIPNEMQKMLDTYPHKKNFYMGHKICVEVPYVDFSKYFTESEINCVPQIEKKTKKRG